jgi:hypothetical protein
MDNTMSIIGLVILGLLAIVGLSLLMAYPTMWLWNWLIPDIFNLTTITFSQALGLNVLTGIFFKSTSYNSSDN